MPTIHWQKTGMTAESISLQGSLFGDLAESPTNRKISPDSTKDDDFSDAELIKNAQARPRPSKSSTDIEPLDHPIGDENPQGSDLTNVSHHSDVEITQLTPVLRHYVELKKRKSRKNIAI